MIDRIKSVVKTLVRRKAPVVFGDLNRVEPVSRVFGLDRGSGIPRYYVDRFMAEHADVICGDALEVGELRYLSRYGEPATRTVLAPSQEAVHRNDGADDTLIADLSDSGSLPAEQFDCFVCTQTFNFIYDVRGAISGARHLLKPGGVLVGTVAGLQQISRYDMDRWGDYWRFTDKSLKRLLGEVFDGPVSVECMGNALAAQLIIQGASVEDLPGTELLDVVDEDFQAILGFVACRST